jgi:hypothetical protein
MMERDPDADAGRDSLPRKILHGLVAALLLWAVIGSVVGWLLGLSPPKPQEGEACGPGYRWTRVGLLNDPDLSCERE